MTQSNQVKFDSFMIEGHPLSILHTGDHDKINLVNLEEFQSVCHKENLKNNKVIVISIIGSLRTGKSFLMNYLLRYLFSKFNESSLSNMDNPLEGFDWISGLSEVTKGIQMWSELIPIKIQNEKVFIILLDMEGLFNRTTSYFNSVKMGALLMIMSNCVIVNCKNSLDVSILDYVENCANYAHWALDYWHLAKPLDSLLFLIRDWSRYSNYSFGLEGGLDLLKYLTMSNPRKAIEEPLINKSIKSYFLNIECCLLPYPGQKVTTAHFDGRIRDLDNKFIDIVRTICSHIFNPQYLSPKTIKSHKITCREWFHYFQSFVAIMKKPDTPNFDCLCQENALAVKWEAVESMQNFYISQMDKFLVNRHNYFSAEKIINEHLNIERNIIDKLNNSPILFKKFTIEEVKSDVLIQLKNINNRYLEDNKFKNLQMGMFTPFSFIILLLFFYLLNYLLINCGYKPIVNITNVCLMSSLCILLIWIVVVCWDIEEFSGILDELADILILYIYSPIFTLIKHKPAKILEIFFQSVSERV